MEYKIYRFAFRGAVHFGKNNLDEGEYSCCADTLFAALCQEALKIGDDVLQDFYHCAKGGDLLLSDLFPYIGDTFFIPKPIKRIQGENSDGNSVVKKAYKKLKYISPESLDSYLAGTFDVLHAQGLEELGHFEMKTAVFVPENGETEPYRIGTYYFQPGNGLYVIIGYQRPETLQLAEKLLEGLSFSGIGGKRAAGLGRFELLSGKMPESLRKRLGTDGGQYMSLSVSLPTDEELETVMQEASYLLCKRSGFVASERYAPTQMRKKDLYVFQAGSCFATGFAGDIYDVAGKGGGHPVYRYAKPMLMEV